MKTLKLHPAVEIRSYIRAFGISWYRDRVWVAAGSPLNPYPRSPVPLACAYEESIPPPPTRADLELLLGELARTVRAEERHAFEAECASLRAASDEFYGL
jgi:hypothetical protein